MDKDTFHIGWLGLSSSGNSPTSYSLAARLAEKGYRLIIRDSDPTQGILFESDYSKCRVATSDPTSFKGCDILVTMLPDINAVREVLFGEKGIAGSLKEGSVVIILAASQDFGIPESLISELAQLPIDVVCAGITGQREGEAKMEDTLVAESESRDALERVVPLLEDLDMHVVCGPLDLRR